MTTCYLAQTHALEFVRQCNQEHCLVVLAARQLWWDQPPDEELCLVALSKPRAAQSVKGFLMPAAESMGRYGAEQSGQVAVESQPLILLGVRACELRARRYLDAVMQEGDFQDPQYVERRRSVSVFSCDCVDCAESCFCPLVGGEPFATEGFDVNFTALDGGFLVEAGSEQGEQWLTGLRSEGASEATPGQLARRDEQRQSMVDRLRRQNGDFDFPASDDSQTPLPNDDAEVWQQFAADCVECGACTNICPTCYCFYLYDQVLGPERFERVRGWDSCLLSSYHRMAGGPSMKLSPRPNLLGRLANRVLHKFTYSPQQYGLLGCVGCGRCVDACLGEIDIRQVVQELQQ